MRKPTMVVIMVVTQWTQKKCWLFFFSSVLGTSIQTPGHCFCCQRSDMAHCVPRKYPQAVFSMTDILPPGIPQNLRFFHAKAHYLRRMCFQRMILLSSVQFCCSVVSDSLWPHRPQHARLSFPSPTPRACANSCPSSRWCHPTVSSSVIPFSSCLQSFPASGSFQMSEFFTSGGQSI